MKEKDSDWVITDSMVLRLANALLEEAAPLEDSAVSPKLDPRFVGQLTSSDADLRRKIECVRKGESGKS